MRAIIFLFLVFLMFQLATAQVNEAYQCPGKESDCILVGGSPCYYSVGPGCTGSYQTFGGVTQYYAWIGDQCFCPYHETQQPQQAQSSCPAGSGSDCIDCGGVACMNTYDASVCKGQAYDQNGQITYLNWLGGSEGCTCYCPYSLLQASKNQDKCAGKTCPTTCSGTTIKKGHCDPQTGDCAFDTGYCQNGCDAAGTDCATNVQIPKTWAQNDQTCDTPKGENCDNSHNDCACPSGWACNLTSPNAREDGCAPTTGFACGDNACDIAKGENCASCGGNDPACACGNYETCSPSATGSDPMGCAITPDSPCNSCDAHACLDGSSRSVSLTKTGCISGKCVYSVVECPNGCDPSTDTCRPVASISADGCLEDGTYIVSRSGQSGSVSVERDAVVTRPDGIRAWEKTTATVKDSATHCAGDFIATDENTKVWIQHKNGRITYVGPRSVYENSRVTPNTDIASGDIQESNIITNPGAQTDDEKGIVTLYPYEISVDMAKGTDYQGRPLVGNLRTLMDPRLDFEHKADVLMNDMLATYFQDYYGLDTTKVMSKQMIAGRNGYSPFKTKQDSNVIYHIGDTGTTITVLEGQVTVVDLSTNAMVTIPKGGQYTKLIGVPPAQGTKSTVDVSALHDNIADMPQPGVCGPSMLLMLLLPLAAIGLAKRHF